MAFYIVYRIPNVDELDSWIHLYELAQGSRRYIGQTGDRPHLPNLITQKQNNEHRQLYPPIHVISSSMNPLQSYTLLGIKIILAIIIKVNLSSVQNTGFAAACKDRI